MNAKELIRGNEYITNDGEVAFTVNKVFKNGKIVITTFDRNDKEHFIVEKIKITQAWFDVMFGPFSPYHA